MNGFHHQERKDIDRFVRRENVARFSRMLTIEQHEPERIILAKLIDEETTSQKNAEDFVTSHLVFVGGAELRIAP